MERHLPNIISFVMDQEAQLESGQSSCVFDRNARVTYVVQPVEKHILLVLILPEKRTDIKFVRLFGAHLASSLAMLAPK